MLTFLAGAALGFILVVLILIFVPFHIDIDLW